MTVFLRFSKLFDLISRYYHNYDLRFRKEEYILKSKHGGSFNKPPVPYRFIFIHIVQLSIIL